MMLHSEIVNKEEAGKVLFDPEIYDRISDDNCPMTIDLPDIDYIGGYVDGQLASINVFHPFRDGYKIHFQCLKQFRKHARDLFDVSMIEEGPIYAEIPTKYPEVVNFAVNMGFDEVSRRQGTYLKNGKIYDKVLLVWDSLAM